MSLYCKCGNPTNLKIREPKLCYECQCARAKGFGEKMRLYRMIKEEKRKRMNEETKKVFFYGE
jgi:hypothetical protein